MEFAKLKRAVIKEEYVALTGNTISALILNQFQYWSERIRDFDEFILEEKNRYESEGKEIKIDLQNGWIYKSYEKLRSELMLTDSAKTVGRYVSKLVELGFLDRRRNPNIKYDRKYQYRLNLVKINEELQKIGYTLQDYRIDFPCDKPVHSKSQIDHISGQNYNLKGQNDHSNGEFDHAIVEIKLENTIESITKTSSKKSDDENEPISLSNNKSNDFDLGNSDLFINKIADTFLKATNKHPTLDDFNSIKEMLYFKTDIVLDLDIRENIIIQTITRIYNDFISKNPDKKINSFRYFTSSIIEEYKKYHQPHNTIDQALDDDVNDFFELAWAKYPKKEGKNDIPFKQKITLFGIKDEFFRCIERYLKYDRDLKINGNWKELQSAKTFFNSGYLNWTDKEFEDRGNVKFKTLSEINKERILALYNSKKEAGVL